MQPGIVYTDIQSKGITGGIRDAPGLLHAAVLHAAVAPGCSNRVVCLLQRPPALRRSCQAGGWLPRLRVLLPPALAQHRLPVDCQHRMWGPQRHILLQSP